MQNLAHSGRTLLTEELATDLVEREANEDRLTLLTLDVLRLLIVDDALRRDDRDEERLEERADDSDEADDTLAVEVTTGGGRSVPALVGEGLSSTGLPLLGLPPIGRPPPIGTPPPIGIGFCPPGGFPPLSPPSPLSGGRSGSFGSFAGFL